MSNTNIVYRMRCARCGRVLRVETTRPNHIKSLPDGLDNGFFDRQPADSVESSTFVHPCEHCYMEAKSPALLLCNAIRLAEEMEKEESK